MYIFVDNLRTTIHELVLSSFYDGIYIYIYINWYEGAGSMGHEWNRNKRYSLADLSVVFKLESLTYQIKTH